MKKTVVGAVIALLAAGLFASLVVVKNLNGRIAELESARAAASATSAAPQAAKPAEGDGKAQEAARPAAEAAKPAADAAKPVEDDGRYVRYVVKAGEDIVGIAIEHAMTPRRIRELNGLTENDQLSAGDVVLLPRDDETEEVAVLKPKPEAKKPSVPKTDYHEMKVLHFSYDGSRRIALRLSEAPDMNVVRQYVTVEPLQEGSLTFSASTGWDENLRKTMPVLQISGEFAYRTNVTLRIRKGFPIANLRSSGNLVAEPLAEEYVHVFERENIHPLVTFADDGRYLPLIGGGRLSLASINVDEIKVGVAKIPSRNVVYGLALEEDAYQRISGNNWYGDGDGPAFASDLAESMAFKTLKMKNPLNEREEVKFALPSAVSGATNGIYLVKLEGKDAKPARRVVCMTDLGLSVRRVAGTRLVWVTSLTKGTPVAGAKIEMYSTANILVAEGVTDTNGLCRCTIPESSQDEFAVVATAPDGSDSSFMALRDSMRMSEVYGFDDWIGYFGKDDVEAFLTTDRGIYRHDEKILCHALVRNGDFAAPAKMPLQVELVKPWGNVYRKLTLVTDEFGALCTEDLAVPADQPSGEWTLRVRIPDGDVIGRRDVKIEEFVPPQIRVKVAAEKGVKPSAFTFRVSAEHLFGGPAKALMCDGAVVFEDAPFCQIGRAHV